MDEIEKILGAHEVLVDEAAQGRAVPAVVIALQCARRFSIEAAVPDQKQRDPLLDLTPESAVGRIECVVEVEHPGRNMSEFDQRIGIGARGVHLYSQTPVTFGSAARTRTFAAAPQALAVRPGAAQVGSSRTLRLPAETIAADMRRLLKKSRRAAPQPRRFPIRDGAPRLSPRTRAARRLRSANAARAAPA